MTKKEEVTEEKIENPKIIVKEETLEADKPKRNSSKWIANTSLAAMAVGFAATLPFDENAGVELLAGGFEAGLVGGLADWFAVTALFKHPLNIPIPHTALLPKNRKRITKAILVAVEEQLLNKESLLAKLENVKFTDIAIEKIEQYTEEEEFMNLIKSLKKNVINYIQENEFEHIKSEIHTVISKKEKDIKTEDVIEKAVDKILEEKYDEKVMEYLIQILDKKLSEPLVRQKINAFVLDLIQNKADHGLFKLALVPLLSMGKEKIEQMVQNGIDGAIADLKNENSATRFNIKKSIKLEINNLKEKEDLLQKIQEKREAFLSEEFYDKTIDKIANEVKTQIIQKVEHDEFDLFIKESVQKMLASLKDNQGSKDKIEHKIKDVLGKTIENNHKKIGDLIKENLDRMSNEELTELLEDKIGREIAWIRVNGSLCGFLIGVGLTAIKMFV